MNKNKKKNKNKQWYLQHLFVNSTLNKLEEISNRALQEWVPKLELLHFLFPRLKANNLWEWFYG